MQDQKLTEVNVKAGVITEPVGTAAEGYWSDADKIRFRFNKPELMGGWQNISNATQTANLIGAPRIIETIRSRAGVKAGIVGTHVGLFATNFSRYVDVTPALYTVSANNILSTQLNSTRVVVSVSAHGLTEETLIGFTSANTTIGDNILINITADTTTSLQVVSIIDANSFEIDLGVSAAATSTLTGGNGITFYAYYPAGTRNNSQSGGWGGGVWGGACAWGTPSGDNIITGLRLWSMDTWGTELMAVPTSGPLMLYSPQNGIFTRFAIISAAPSINQIVRVAAESRHVILYGTHDVLGVYDPLLVRWCSQEDYTDWTPTSVNTAGDFPLNSSGSKIMGVVKMRDQQLILTDADAFAQAYIGPTDIFGFSRIGEKCGLIGQNAAIEHAGVVYWMSNARQFFKYDGRLQPLTCTMLRYVFDNLDTAQVTKIFAGTNAEFDELIWLYPDLNSANGEPNRYIIYNTIEQHWVGGSMPRSAWKDRSVVDQILATGHEDEGVFYQELGTAADTSALEAFAEMTYFKSQDGDDIMFCHKAVPDLRVPDGEPYPNVIEYVMKSRKYPGGEEITKGPYALLGNTEKISLRLRGREYTVRLQSSTVTQPKWRLNSLRLGLQADGKR